jgi:CRP-like cAMP-binding protein
MPPSVVEALASTTVTHIGPKGNFIVREAERGGDLYLLFQGTLLVNRYSDMGREVAYGHILPGGHFGEISAIDGEAHSANVLALTQTRIGRIPARTVTGLLASSPAFSRALLEDLAGSVRGLRTRLFEMNTTTFASRIRRELVRLARERGLTANQATLDPRPTHAELASLAGGQREMVTRELGRLTAAGLIQRTGRSLHIPDISALIGSADGGSHGGSR